MSDREWTDGLMVHGWPECGPGTITLDELYLMFKAREALERHEESCWLRNRGESCDCSVGKTGGP